MMITEESAVRLASAIERIADILERAHRLARATRLSLPGIEAVREKNQPPSGGAEKTEQEYKSMKETESGWGSMVVTRR